jgi:alanine racemase
VNSDIVRRVWAHPGRSTRAIVDLDAIAANVGIAKRKVGAGVGVMAVVKANGYGHGAVSVSRTALANGADRLAVATVDEGIFLRNAGIQTSIQVLGPADRSEIDLALGRGLELSVGDIDFAQAIADHAGQIALGSAIPVHLKIDTGMHRFGIEPARALAIASFVHEHPSLRLRSVFTHFALADDEDEGPTDEQESVFEAILNSLSEVDITPDFIHSANSAAVLRSDHHYRNLVRLGIGLYGLNPSANVPIAGDMRPAMTLVSRVRRIIDLAPGDGVSYGGTYRASRFERAALVPIGYADGYRRANSNLGSMSIAGRSCAVEGRVCMDQTVIGLPDELGEIKLGQTVIVGGAWIEDQSVPTLDRMAEWANTINYEIATGISQRVPRYYVRGGNVVAIEDLFGHRTLHESNR